MSKDTTQVRIQKDLKCQLDEVRKNMTKNEGKEVSYPELFRRTFKIPELKQVLYDDSKLKGGKK